MSLERIDGDGPQDVESRYQCLRTNPVMAKAGDEALQRMARYGRTFRSSGAGDVLIERGAETTAAAVYLVLSGVVRVLRLDEKYLLGFRGPGALLGAHVPVTLLPHGYRTETAEPCRLLWLRGEMIGDAAAGKTSFMKALFRALHAEFEEEAAYRELQMKLPKPLLPAVLALQVARARFGTCLPSRPIKSIHDLLDPGVAREVDRCIGTAGGEMLLEIAPKDLAWYVGISTKSLGRTKGGPIPGLPKLKGGALVLRSCTEMVKAITAQLEPNTVVKPARFASRGRWTLRART